MVAADPCGALYGASAPWRQPFRTTHIHKLILPFTRYKDAPAAELSFGPALFALATEKDDVLRLRSPRDVGCVTQGVYFYVEDVDAHFERAKAAGAEIVRAIEDTDYGSREYTARDLEGHLWGFGTYMLGSGA